MSLRRSKVLLIDCGTIGERHVRAFLGTGRANLIACDDRANVRAQIAERYRVPILADWRDALLDREIDAVAIGIPAPDHVRLAEAFLSAGKDVFV